MSREDREKLKYIKRRRASHETFNILVEMLAAKHKTIKEILNKADKLVVKKVSVN